MKTTSLTILIALSASSITLADDQYSTPGEQVNDMPSSETLLPGGLFQRMDVNGDGFVNNAEAARSQELSSAFGRLDDNNDGLLNSEEFSDYDANIE